jgi:predicted TIM-barrel fold metal-dependent hydrolase
MARLRDLIDATPWVDTHEHIVEERRRLAGPLTIPDADVIPRGWTGLIVHYCSPELVSAGLPPDAPAVLFGEDASPLEKWELAAPYLERSRATGYVHAVDLTTERLFGLRLARDTVEEIDGRLRELQVPGYYEQILRTANITRCQVHSLEVEVFCETATPDLLQQDLSLVPLALGSCPEAEDASGIEVGTLDDYLAVVDWCFERYARRAVAAKCFWAYLRPLAIAVPETPPRREFERLRAGTADLRDQRLVEDFLFQRCVDLATDCGLPVKMHLGYLDGNRQPQLQWVRDHVNAVGRIVDANPRTSFVLMHMAWPHQEELLALAKHLPNANVDLCWAWILSPIATAAFVERFLTTAPASKLLCFGGDYFTIEPVIGHAEIARRGLQHALEQLVARGWLRLEDALRLVPTLMHGNAERLFPPRLADGTQLPAS